MGEIQLENRRREQQSDGKTGAMLNGLSQRTAGSRYSMQRVHPCKTFKGTGNLHELEAAASSPCRVVRAREVRVACGRPGPAVAAAPTRIRVSTPHLPVC